VPVMRPAVCAVALCLCLSAWSAPTTLAVKGYPGFARGSTEPQVTAPVRDVFRALGYSQQWEPTTDTVTLKGAAGTLTLHVGSAEAQFVPAGATEGRTAQLPVPARYVGGRFCAPLEALWKAAGVSYTVIKRTRAAVEYEIGGLHLTVNLMSEEESTISEQAKGSVVKLETAKGNIVLELFDDKTPVTVGSFLDLVGKGFYDGLTFHRVIADFMIQGGCPKGNGTGGPGFTIPDEADRGLRHERGSLSMAKTAAPNSGGSQFFICHVPCNWLDGIHTVFGKCTEGLDVVDAIRQGDRITSAVLLSKSEAADGDIEKALAARVEEK
jgi:peptidyl-prolyl cis-trans isomerase B (cyclophilin B)